MEDKKKKSIASIIEKVITIIVLVIAILMMIFTIISVTTVGKNNRSIFGYKLYIDLTDSMSPEYFSAGDIVITKEVDVKTIKAGDVITFQSLMPGETYGEAVTHKVREVKESSAGVISFVTYGVATGVNDSLEVASDFVLGKYVGKVSKLGYFFEYLKTPAGYILLILVPFIIIIGLQGIKSVRLFKKYKKEQTEKLQQEKEQLEKEREQSQLMMKELLELKAKLAEQENKEKDKKE